MGAPVAVSGAYFGQEADVAGPYNSCGKQWHGDGQLVPIPGKTSEQAGLEEQKIIVPNYDRVYHVLWSRSLEPRGQDQPQEDPGCPKYSPKNNSGRSMVHEKHDHQKRLRYLHY